MNLNIKILAIAAACFSSYCLADQYNHGNHNDPQQTWAVNAVSTFSCGSSYLSSCIANANTSIITQQKCRDLVTDDTDGILLYGSPYYHSIISYGVRVLSAIDSNSGSGSYAYTIDVQYSCVGYRHPGNKLSRRIK